MIRDEKMIEHLEMKNEMLLSESTSFPSQAGSSPNHPPAGSRGQLILNELEKHWPEKVDMRTDDNRA